MRFCAKIHRQERGEAQFLMQLGLSSKNSAKNRHFKYEIPQFCWLGRGRGPMLAKRMGGAGRKNNSQMGLSVKNYASGYRWRYGALGYDGIGPAIFAITGR